MSKFEEQLEYALELFSSSAIYIFDSKSRVASCTAILHCKDCKLALQNGCFVHVYQKQVWEALEEKYPEFFL